MPKDKQQAQIEEIDLIDEVCQLKEIGQTLKFLSDIAYGGVYFECPGDFGETVLHLTEEKLKIFNELMPELCKFSSEDEHFEPILSERQRNEGFKGD